MLLEALKDKGVTLQQRWGYKKELQDFARNNAFKVVDIKEQIAPTLASSGVVRTVWQSVIRTMHAWRKKRCNHRCGGLILLLWHLLAKRHDFKGDFTALQYLGSQLGVVVDLATPKFHAKLAGEGVEYSWAHAKAFYWRMSISRKQGCDNFKQLVKDCACRCPINLLTKEGIEKFASWVRVYICTYHHLEQQQQQAAAAAVMRIRIPLSPPAVCLVLLRFQLTSNRNSYTPKFERLKKAFKSQKI